MVFTLQPLHLMTKLVLIVITKQRLCIHVTSVEDIRKGLEGQEEDPLPRQQSVKGVPRK